MAGLFDGEGSIALYWTNDLRRPGKRYARVIVGLSQSDNGLLQFVQQLLGAGYLRRVGGPSRKSHWKPASWLGFRINEVEDLLTQILPYLKLKHAHATLVLEFLQTRENVLVDRYLTHYRRAVAVENAQSAERMN